MASADQSARAALTPLRQLHHSLKSWPALTGCQTISEQVCEDPWRSGIALFNSPRIPLRREIDLFERSMEQDEPERRSEGRSIAQAAEECLASRPVSAHRQDSCV